MLQAWQYPEIAERICPAMPVSVVNPEMYEKSEKKFDDPEMKGMIHALVARIVGFKEMKDDYMPAFLQAIIDRCCK